MPPRKVGSVLGIFIPPIKGGMMKYRCVLVIQNFVVFDIPSLSLLSLDFRLLRDVCVVVGVDMSSTPTIVNVRTVIYSTTSLLL